LLCDKEVNIVKSLELAGKTYRDFKNTFLQIAAEIEYSQAVAEFVDQVMVVYSRVKTEDTAFSSSDMIGSGAYRAIAYTVEDTGIKTFALTEKFDLNTPSNRAVYVYRNNMQLLHGIDYTFNGSLGFVTLTVDLVEGDAIEIREYSSTAFNFIPPTPTKFGLYKKYVPEKFLDDTYRDPIEVIRGHDGSITVAFGDYRDDLLL
jgi:hypothetical protein